jgi:hypothetical protein
MIRRFLIPRFASGGWTGGFIDGGDADGRYFVVEWLGFVVELSIGRAHRP